MYDSSFLCFQTIKQYKETTDDVKWRFRDKEIRYILIQRLKKEASNLIRAMYVKEEI